MKARPPSRLIARGEGRVAKAVTLISIGGQKNESATEDD
jgi:hypothetical protein